MNYLITDGAALLLGFALSAGAFAQSHAIADGPTGWKAYYQARAAEAAAAYEKEKNAASPSLTTLGVFACIRQRPAKAPPGPTPSPT